MFPNGSPTGLAYARSGKMPGMTGMLDGMGSVMDLFQKFTYNSNSNQESGGKPQVVYGGVTHNENNRYRNHNIRGSISYGSNTVQNRNRYD